MNKMSLDRRQFLALGSTAVVGATLAPRALAAPGAAATTIRQAAVGFNDGSFLADGKQWGRVQSADSLLAGDAEFVTRGARVSVYGLAGSEGPLSHPKTRIDLHAHFPYFDGVCRRMAPFMAWSYGRQGKKTSAPVSFTMPVDDEGRLVFSLSSSGTVTTASSDCVAPGQALIPTADTTWITLSAGGGTGPKLQRGFYFIAPLSDAEAGPRWEWLRLGGTDAKKSRISSPWALQEETAFSTREAEFEHLVLWIDWAQYDDPLVAAGSSAGDSSRGSLEVSIP